MIASGGVGTLEHMVEGIRDGHATAVLAASIFHFGEHIGARGQGLHGQSRAADAARSVISSARMSKFTLADLEKRVHERAKASAANSYTRALLDKGVAHCAKKLGEEAIETAMAAVQEDKGRLIAEAADLLYHLLVVLEARGVTLAEVEAELKSAPRNPGTRKKLRDPAG